MMATHSTQPTPPAAAPVKTGISLKRVRVQNFRGIEEQFGRA